MLLENSFKCHLFLNCFEQINYSTWAVICIDEISSSPSAWKKMQDKKLGSSAFDHSFTFCISSLQRCASQGVMQDPSIKAEKGNSQT